MDHVGQEGSVKAVKRAMTLAIGWTTDRDNTVDHFQTDIRINQTGQFTLGALYRNVIFVHEDLNPGGNTERKLAYS